MSLPSDIRPIAADLRFLPVRTRVPLKFGPETLTEVTCARARVRVARADGRVADGWGETPLSVQWVWPSTLPYGERHEALKRFTALVAARWVSCMLRGHPLEVGHDFIEGPLRDLLDEFNRDRPPSRRVPWLAALVCCSPFDLAVHDAYGRALGLPTWETYGPEHLSRDLAAFIEPARDVDVTFSGKYPRDYLRFPRPDVLPAWHLVGGKDPVVEGELTGREPDDGYPVLLSDWIERDGLRCLKVKLRGDDEAWDFERLVRVGSTGRERGVLWLSADFNGTVEEPAYVCRILDRLLVEEPRIYAMILYVEQPFPHELEEHPIDAHSVSARKPLFLDESAHDWRVVRLGRSLGWTGVALKTCKTQSGAILSLSWARAHGMTLMVQDLTNPMLAQVPHVLLAAHAATIMGVETNAMQFYPEASAAEAVVHPGLYRRRDGGVDLSTIRGPGFGYRLEEIERELPPPVASFGE